MVKFVGALDGFSYVSTFCNNKHDYTAGQDSLFWLCPPGNGGWYENSGQWPVSRKYIIGSSCHGSVRMLRCVPQNMGIYMKLTTSSMIISKLETRNSKL